MKKSELRQIKISILQKQIFRLSKIYLSKPVSVFNIKWHNRVGNLQVNAITEKKRIINTQTF